ncbi:MAG: hypothetical protein F6K56_12915 [Moorea sp. SIO3G5]|nr:hypothetical protein [Moorena sp. SIO3G5]
MKYSNFYKKIKKYQNLTSKIIYILYYSATRWGMGNGEWGMGNKKACDSTILAILASVPFVLTLARSAIQLNLYLLLALASCLLPLAFP